MQIYVFYSTESEVRAQSLVGDERSRNAVLKIWKMIEYRY